MADSDATQKRLVGLTKLFNAAIQGHRELKSSADGNRFLEALCAQPDASKCVENIIAAPKGLTAIAKTFRFSRDSAFLNGPSTTTLHYLSNPSIKQLYEGQFLHRILEAITQPPTYWNTLVEAHHARILTEEGTHAFAWLLLQLLCCRSEDIPDVKEVAERITQDESFITAPLLEVRNMGQKIKHIIDSISPEGAEDGPGGRHDNDFADYREVKILPTPDEFSSTERPFYRRADVIESVELGQRGMVHIDNQFRLLREDLLGELRNDYQIAIGAKRGRRRTVLNGLKFVGLYCGLERSRRPCSVQLLCTNDIPQWKNVDAKQRKKYLTENRSFLKHQSLGCLVSNGGIVGFATVDRDEDQLLRKPPILVLRVADRISFDKLLFASKFSQDLQFVQVDTAVFAYEPILRCLQNMTDVPLHDQLLDLHPGACEVLSGIHPGHIFNAISERRGQNLQDLLGTSQSVNLDAAQVESLLNGISKRASLIQGPPGTGKSFIGALIAKILHAHTSEKILVLTYTNHALDQFLEDLLEIGIPPDSIVRLGRQSSVKTKMLSIHEQRNNYKESPQTYSLRQAHISEAEGYHDSLGGKVPQFCGYISNRALLDYLEFSGDSEFFDAFQVPESDDGMTLVGSHGRSIDAFYLLQRWIKGKNAGIFREVANRDYSHIWALEEEARIALMRKWKEEMTKEQVSEISHLVQKYNQCRERIDSLSRKRFAHVVGQKRIVASTTTAAAKYYEDIRTVSPGIVMVEEAGEILESHVLTALSPDTKQLVLIGDHKQLRPKINNFSLTVEKGDGYNLNQSLFERLVLSGVPHVTLNHQHRMRPEISALVKSLTYPELRDAPKTEGRPPLRGFQDTVIFVSHNMPELNAERIAERRDDGANSSKENIYEANMVLKCVRYLGQQGYGTDQIVVLTPYLGQLYLLLKTLSRDNDPILNDLDSFELIRAGLLSPAGANISKRKIKISTIDNYQGEESDIVIASLTRSNAKGDIGFMSAPQRVNVLLSRARNALIMVGNADTFLNSRKGKDVWCPLMGHLKRSGHVYDGFPVRCEQHPDKKALLQTKEDFDRVCPDGGCSDPCGIMLSCGAHTCPQRCHQLQDHSKMKCEAIIKWKCPQNHQLSRRCYDKAAASCMKCEEEARAKEKRRQRDYSLEQERQSNQRAYAAQLFAINEEIEYQKRRLKDEADETDRKNALAQKKQDLEDLKRKVRDAQQKPSLLRTDRSVSDVPETNQSSKVSPVQTQATATPSISASTENAIPRKAPTESDKALPDWEESKSKDDWEWQKQFEGAQNEALDALMAMIGLESVKEKFLAIKAKVDTCVRQSVSLKNERFGAALLGNPGTGKTTVARLYAQFLVKVGALPGDHFFESSGSALANDGVSACKGYIDKILEAGGGVFFIDEAYQLVSGNSYGGKAVLDFLLAEIENLTGKIVFVLAGYHKQMEAFFAHNPGIPSRIPVEMEFQDYNDHELHRIFSHNINARYKGNMRIEGGMEGLYVRIVARRLGRGRGRDGFGNARDVQNRIAQITEHQAKRLRKERKEGLKPDDHFLTQEDLIGPEPSAVLNNNAAWNKLQKLIGLKSVKDSVQVLLDGIQYNYQRELEEKPLVQYSLNRCFIGSPGTGKTSVAKLYGRILADIGLLSNGEVVVKNPADFVGDVLGASESKTKAILASTVGKVLIIDEAYMLASGASADPYKAAVIDTIVAEVQSTPGEDRCVLLLGYKDQMEEMFRDVNPGLARRFPLDSAFVFEDFTDPELRCILDLKLRDVGYNATDQAKKVAMEMLQRARNRPNFGNAGEVDIILDRAKALHQKHLSNGKVKNHDTFEAIDFDPDFDRGERAATNLPQLFRDVVGCEGLIRQFQGYQITAANMKSLGMDPREQIPFNFLFKGPPGTGKTTTAQKMGKVFYDMGFIAQAKVIECSATDLIGQYVGQTGPKVQKLLEKALGKVLFIDEAYRLAEGSFATEAMDELVDCLTKPKFARKLVTILAGYDKDIDRLMSINPGLTSRFSESVIFPSLDPTTCLELLVKILRKRAQQATLDITILESPSTDFKQKVVDLFGELSRLESWGNARDVKSLASEMFGSLIKNTAPPISSLTLSEDVVLIVMEDMLDERSRRSEAVGTARFPFRNPLHPIPQPQQQQPNAPAPRPLRKTSAKKTTAQAPPPPAPVDKPKTPPPIAAPRISEDEEPAWFTSIFNAKRDPGISDATWEQLQQDKHAAVARERDYIRRQKEKEEERQRIEALKKAEQAARDEEEKRRSEKERIEAELDRRRNEAIRAELERQREREKLAQKKLRELGPCPAGYRWIKQQSGYRCAGGSHWLSDEQLWQYSK